MGFLANDILPLVAEENEDNEGKEKKIYFYFIFNVVIAFFEIF